MERQTTTSSLIVRLFVMKISADTMMHRLLLLAIPALTQTAVTNSPVWMTLQTTFSPAMTISTSTKEMRLTVRDYRKETFIENAIRIDFVPERSA